MENMRERDHWGDPDVDGRIILRWIDKWDGVVGRMVEGRGVHRVLVGKPLGRPRRRWEDNIKMDLGVGWGCGAYGGGERCGQGSGWKT